MTKYVCSLTKSEFHFSIIFAMRAILKHEYPNGAVIEYGWVTYRGAHLGGDNGDSSVCCNRATDLVLEEGDSVSGGGVREEVLGEEGH